MRTMTLTLQSPVPDGLSTEPRQSAHAWASRQLEALDGVITAMESTAEEAWRVETVRSEDGATNCFFGHLFNLGGDDKHGSALWNVFEEQWATTYMLYPVNDGQNPKYPQDTPKQRVLAYLRDLRDGKAMTTLDLWAEDARRYEEETAASR